MRLFAIGVLAAAGLLAPSARAAEDCTAIIDFTARCQNDYITVTYWTLNPEVFDPNWAGARFYRRQIIDVEGPKNQIGPDLIPRSSPTSGTIQYIDTAVDPSASYEYSYELVDMDGNPSGPMEECDGLTTSRNYVSCSRLLLGSGEVEVNDGWAVWRSHCVDAPLGISPEGARLECPGPLIESGATVRLYGERYFEVDIIVSVATECFLLSCTVPTSSASWSAVKSRY